MYFIETLAQTLTSPFGVALLMGGLCLVSIALGTERFLTLRRIRRENRAFVKEASPMLVDWQLASIEELATKHPESPVAKLFARMSSRYLAGVQSNQGMSPLDLAEGEAQLQVQASAEVLKRGLRLLPILATLTFTLGALSALSSAVLIFALGQAALGLLAAIATALSYRFLKNRAAQTIAALHHSAEAFLEEMSHNHDIDTMHHVLQEVG